MARPFSFPAVAALPVGESTCVTAPRSEVARKVKLYGARKGRAYAVSGTVDPVTVTRLPDPVKEEA